MKTIEEINEIAPYHPCEWQQGYGIWQSGFMEGQKVGAAEQKAIDDEQLPIIKETYYNAGYETAKNKMIDKECETMVGCAAKEVKQVYIDKAKNAFIETCGWLAVYQWYNGVFEEFVKAMEK